MAFDIISGMPHFGFSVIKDREIKVSITQSSVLHCSSHRPQLFLFVFFKKNKPSGKEILSQLIKNSCFSAQNTLPIFFPCISHVHFT